MARFLSEDWVAAFNAALQSADLGTEIVTSVRAESGRFSVEEQVSGVPGRPEAAGPLRMVLRVDDGEVSLSLEEGPEHDRSDVVVSLSYEDAAALSRGELDPAQALSTGRVRVRGDLAVLVAGQGILAAASSRMTALQAGTTY